MIAKDAARWHRVESDRASGRAKRATIHKHAHTTPMAAHDLAARVLDALAVLPPVLFDNLLAKHGGVLTEDQRTALRTLADAAKGE